jgi:hypothetical protein
MKQDAPADAREYLARLPADRAATLSRLRDTVREHLPEGFEETIEFGMIAYVVPLSRHPKTYNGRPLLLCALASQKNHLALYLTGLYTDEGRREAFEEAFRKAGKKLDAGKSCVRFDTLDDLAMDAVTSAIEALSVDDLVALHEATHGAARKTTSAKTSTPAKGPASGKVAAKSTETNKTATPKRAAAPKKAAATEKSPTTKKAAR